MNNNFIDDKDKMFDFIHLSKNEFLYTYNYITEEEWKNTLFELYCRFNERVLEKNK